MILNDGGLKHRLNTGSETQKTLAVLNIETISMIKSWCWHWFNLNYSGPTVEKYTGKSNSFHPCYHQFESEHILRPKFPTLWLRALMRPEIFVSGQQNT